jgi:hypothetical protein
MLRVMAESEGNLFCVVDAAPGARGPGDLTAATCAPGS